MLIGEKIPDDLFPHMFEILNAQVLDAESHFNHLFSKDVFSHDKYLCEKKLTRQKEILLNIQMKCIGVIQKNNNWDPFD